MGEREQVSSEERVAKSYIWYGLQCFFVSTIDRESSAMLAQGARYAETLVWIFDWQKNERGELIYSDSAHEGSIHTHLVVCERLHDKGIRGLVKDEL